MTTALCPCLPGILGLPGTLRNFGTFGILDNFGNSPGYVDSVSCLIAGPYMVFAYSFTMRRALKRGVTDMMA